LIPSSHTEQHLETKSMTRSGPGNPFWKGGRTVTEHGYVLIRKPGHHLADVRGYVYEHRLVAEEKLGRRLGPNEEPHHINGIRSDNRPENIEICKTRAHHFVHHRIREKFLRLPEEDNPIVSCLCGCGETFPKYDKTRRPRRFISGHNLKRKG